jgi:tryptophan-rich sensory protein
MKKRQFNFAVLVICIIIVFALLGGIGSIFSSKSTNSEWYQSVRPSITPPNWIFPVVWNFLFVLISFSLYYAWTNSRNKKQKRNITILFGINFIFNILWTVLFFGLRQTILSFVDLIFLLMSIIILIIFVRKISIKSAWLLVPYLIWITFAGILNFLIAF